LVRTHPSLAAIAAASLLLSACDAHLPAKAAAARTPRSNPGADYSAQIKVRATWSGFPLLVYFTRDSAYSEAREQYARAGFSKWTAATHGFVVYSVVDRADAANIVVRFDPETNDGYTTTHFTDSRIGSAVVRIGVRKGRAYDIKCIAAHEFGHALGLDGHSGQKSDVMYPVHTMGSAWSITRRDLNTP
jgi:predicted Zn-dependent protease